MISNLPTVDDWVSILEKQYTVVDVVNCDVYSPNSTDLFNRIKSNYRSEFNQDDRIILTITKDYHKDQHPVMMLQSIQTMLNEIDISNFFVCIVSTDLDIDSNYDWIAKNISTDAIPVHLYKASGEYTNSISTYTAYQKFSGLGNNSDIVNQMSDREKHLLLESKTFCILPWVSQYTTPDNRVNPCCYFAKDNLGDAGTHSLEEIWNNSKTRQLRLDMLAEKPVTACNVCYLREQVYKDDTISRASYNRDFIEHFKKVTNTNSDGSLDQFELNLLNYKPNNLCNLQCRMCTSEFSSSLHQIERAIGKTVIGGALKQNNPNLLEQYTKHIDHLQQVIFEGGEPLMMKETYDFVELLDKHKRHDIRLMYITNMTHTGLGKRQALDIWRNFSNIIVYASLDAEHDRGLYLRPGSYEWNQIVDFRRKMIEQRPDIFFCVQSTLTLLNALHMPDFHRSWVEQGLVDAEHVMVHTLTNRQYLKVSTAPEYLKDQIREKYRKHLEWLRPIDPYGKSTSGYMSILHALDSNDQFDADLFWKEIEQRDRIHNANLLESFPELSGLPR
jgi:MoaA/NifB/PqqE/SkfB family radical SAM enzyme